MNKRKFYIPRQYSSSRDMKFTKNEREIISFLVKNARISDAEIARNMEISLQAVRKTRKKLESSKVIRGYSTEVDYSSLGIEVIAIAFLQITPSAWEKFKESTIKKWLTNSNAITHFRVLHGNVSHIIEYGFKDIDELNDFFGVLHTKYGRYVNLVSLYTLSHKNVERDYEKHMLHHLLNNKENNNAGSVPKMFEDS